MSIYENKERCPFSFCKKGNLWAVYDNNSGSKIDEFINREEAKIKVYELNGWNHGKK